MILSESGVQSSVSLENLLNMQKRGRCAAVLEAIFKSKDCYDLMVWTGY